MNLTILYNICLFIYIFIIPIVLIKMSPLWDCSLTESKGERASQHDVLGTLSNNNYR